MKPIIVCGNTETRKASSIAYKLAAALNHEVDLYNGMLPDSIEGSDLVIWMPDIPNEKPKHRPKKDRGAVMIISKVIHDDRTEVDAISRIFDFGANAVICIYKDDPKKMRFRLIDALGNTWCGSDDIGHLADAIKDLYAWSKAQIRMSFTSKDDPPYIFNANLSLPEKFIELNTMVADKVEGNLGARYFGNFSTRCMKLFPSARLSNNVFMFSPRNVDKRRITKDDFVVIEPPYTYSGRKYSVDAPVQVQLYNRFDDINFMIHGHATATHARHNFPTTENYYPCGDLREVEEVSKIFSTGVRIVNLKNHGFLLAASELSTLRNMVERADFLPNNMLRED